MAIVRMKRLELYSLLGYREKFLHALQMLGIVEIDRESENTTGTDELESRHAELEKSLAEINRIFNLFDRFLPQTPSIIEQFSGVRTVLTAEEKEKLLADRDEFKAVVKKALEAESEYNRLEQEITRIERELIEAEPWLGLETPVDFRDRPNYFRMLLGAIDDEREEFISRMEQSGIPYVLQEFGRKDHKICVAVYSPKKEAAAQAVRDAGFSDSLPPNKTGVVKEYCHKLNAQLDILRQRLAEEKEALRSLAGRRRMVQFFYDQIYNEKLRTEAAMQAAKSRKVFMLQGWVEEKQEKRLRESLQKLDLPYTLEIRPAVGGEQPPVALKNPPLATPFEALVQSFSYPQTHEVDPTLAVASFFTLFFGIALGDALYGAILSVFCFFLLRKMALKPAGRKLAWMFLLSGMGAVFVGALTASFLGFSPYKGLFNPLKQPTVLLGIALALGLIHLYIGIGISAFMAIRDGRWKDAVWNQGTWLLFLTSLLLVMGKEGIGLGEYSIYVNYGALAAASLVVAANMRGKEGVAAKLLAIPGGLYALYNSIGFFSDVLSYSRLMALGLSGGVMASIINMFAGMTWRIPWAGWLVSLLILVLGHGLNLALSILGAYVHSSRLQFLEFYGKFYEGGGRIFAPLKWENVYIFSSEK
ncbi:MAG: V-type ATP synthase subunit I [Bacillota bacterium]